jgi:hypothetical protein
MEIKRNTGIVYRIDIVSQELISDPAVCPEAEGLKEARCRLTQEAPAQVGRSSA